MGWFSKKLKSIDVTGYVTDLFKQSYRIAIPAHYVDAACASVADPCCSVK